MRWFAIDRAAWSSLRVRLTLWNTLVALLMVLTCVAAVRFSARTALTREAKLGCVFTQTTTGRDGEPLRDPDSTTYTATIGTTWVEDENTGVKTQSVAIAGVTAQSTAMVDHVYTGSGTSDDYAAFVEAENQYLNCITNGYAETYNGGIKFTIFGDANTVSIPIVAEVS